MPSTHTVVQGEHLSSIADQYGFTDYNVIWNDANNADLKQQRVNPNVLQAGDSVYIPDKQQKDESGATTQRHIFNLNQTPLMLRLLFEDAYEKPVANAPCTLYLGQDKSSVTSDGTGKLEKRITPKDTSGTVVLGTADTPYQDDQLQISIGELDPIDSLSGQAARLNNLGYFAGTPATADDAQFESAVEEFQCDQSLLPVDGVPGAQTQAKLKAVHGC
jgi:LysM repeat protein